MTLKLELNNVTLTVRVRTVDGGEIPENLALATQTILGLHKANGDLAWVSDTITDMERAKYALAYWSSTADESQMPDINQSVLYDENGEVKGLSVPRPMNYSTWPDQILIDLANQMSELISAGGVNEAAKAEFDYLCDCLRAKDLDISSVVVCPSV